MMSKFILLIAVVALAGCAGNNNSPIVQETKIESPVADKGQDKTECCQDSTFSSESNATAADWNRWDESKRKEWCYSYYCNLYPEFRAKAYTPLLMESIDQEIAEYLKMNFTPDDLPLDDLTMEADLYKLRKRYKDLFDF